ncbi:hypothetical protein V5O48_012479 [Marasmius crinis-equi]|uniref:Uncharacterized protein n=1 Tax=Marasmius crinis-equi TaxID=585013 RepID=A0ABR3F2M6_9AGAR
MAQQPSDASFSAQVHARNRSIQLIQRPSNVQDTANYNNQSNCTNSNAQIQHHNLSQDSYDPQGFLCLINPNHTLNNDVMFNQIKIITADVLRVTRNAAFAQVEQTNVILEDENRHLRTMVHELQTKLLAGYMQPTFAPSVSAPPPTAASSLTTPANPASNSSSESTRPNPADCKVTWWSKPASTDRAAFARVKVTASNTDDSLEDDGTTSNEDDSDSDDNGKAKEKPDKNDASAIFAWMQQPDGTLITPIQKNKAYRDLKSFWNARSPEEPPLNYSNIDYKDEAAYIGFLEERNPWLAYCDDHWKAKEMMKKNYKSWKKTFDRRKAKKARKEKTREGGSKPKKNSGKGKAKAVEKLPVYNLSDLESGDDDKEPRSSFNPSGSTSSDTSKLSNSKGKESADKAKAPVQNGRLSAKNIPESLKTVSVDMDSLARKACQNKTFDSPTPSLPPALVVSDTPVPRIQVVEDLTAKVNALPKTIPLADKKHPFHVYAKHNNVGKYTEGIATEELWETYDGPFTDLIKTGDHNAREHLIVRGKSGLPAFVRLVRHLAYNRGMDTAVLIPKLERLIVTIDFVVATANKTSQNEETQKKKRKSDASSEDIETTKPAKKTKTSVGAGPGSRKVPDYISPKWLYAKDWKLAEGNAQKSKSAFEEHWTDFEKNEKDKLKPYVALSRKLNSEAVQKSQSSANDTAGTDGV